MQLPMLNMRFGVGRVSACSAALLEDVMFNVVLSISYTTFKIPHICH